MPAVPSSSPNAHRLIRSASWLSTILLGILVGCGSPPSPRHTIRRPKVVKPPSVQPQPPQAPPLLPAHVVAQLDDEEASPYISRKGDELLLLYASGGKWWTRRLALDGAPKSEPLDVGPAPADAPIVAFRPVTQGYLAAWIENVERNHAVKLLALDNDGKALGPVTQLLQSAEDIAWLDVLPNAKGALVLWEVPRDDRADVMMSVVSANKPSAPTPVSRNVLGWDAVATAQGAVVAVVRAGTPSPKTKMPAQSADVVDAKTGEVALLELDVTGKASVPIVVSTTPSAQIDVELVEVGGRYLVAWTDARDVDTSVYVAALEPGGKIIAAPRRATPPAGEQALVSLVSTPYTGDQGARLPRALLAWEDLIQAPEQGRVIHLATMGSDGTIGKERASLLFSASGPPDLVADDDGFAALTLAPASHTEIAASNDAPVWPAFVRFGPDLAVRASEPVRAEPFAKNQGVPYLVRGLACYQSTCTALASDPVSEQEGSPATLALVSLPIRQSGWRAPALRESDDVPPRATTLTSLYSGDHLARVAATQFPDGSKLAAWVTYYLEGTSTDRKQKDNSATLGVRAIDAKGVLGKTLILSQKASSLGGVAVATAPERPRGSGANQIVKAESTLAWVARERGENHVYVTKFDAFASKLAQKKLTLIPRKQREGVPNEPSDVAIAYDGDEGWIVAWIDTRDGNAEVYVARVDRSLNKTIPDRRITNATGDAAEVQIFIHGRETWLFWSDARQAGDEGNGDIYMARLDTKTLQKIGDDTRLFTSAQHSRSPSVASMGGRVVLAWIEEAIEGGTTSDAGIRVAQLDDKAMLIGAPALVRTDQAPLVSSVALACDTSCRGVFTSSSGDSLSLGAFQFPPDGNVESVKTLATLAGSSTQDVSPAFAERSATSLFFADDAVGGSGRVRWMTIAWQ